MFLFCKPGSGRKKGKKSVTNEIREALVSFLERGKTFAKSLVSFWKDQQAVCTYEEIRQAVDDGSVSPQMFHDWQQDYSKMVVEKIVPEWKKAMETGAANQMRHKNLSFAEFKFNSDHWAVREWLDNHTAELVTNCSKIQKEAIQAYIDMGIQGNMRTAEIAKRIRPCIGLTKPQMVANKRFYDNMVNQLRKDHPKMSESEIRKKAGAAADKYGERQLKQRAETIARTERAKAYEYGRYQHMKRLMEEGILPPQKKVWYSAKNEAVCETCKELHGQEVGMDEFFLDGASNPVYLPPLHPNCRCCIMYEDDIMTEKEERAIVDYVGPSKSYIINDKLRRHLKLSDDDKEMVKNLDSALKRFPRYTGDLKRTVWFDNEDQIRDFVDSIKPGKNKVFPEYLSTSSMEGYNDDAPIVIYIQHSRKGRNLLEYGKNEGEVLYERWSEFHVINKVYHEGQWFIVLEEAD